MMKGICLVWVAGQHVTIDESMIRYCGRAVSYVQYMPAKPIKHKINVFCICCVVSAIILVFNVYCGKEEGVDNTAVKICEQLCVEEVGLTLPRGVRCTLTTTTHPWCWLSLCLKNKARQ